MQRLPPIIAIPRPGYMEHTYLLVAQIYSQTIEDEQWDMLSYIDCAGDLEQIPATTAHRTNQTCRVNTLGSRANVGTLRSLKEGTQFKMLPFQLRSAHFQDPIPLVYFFTTGFLPGNVHANRKIMLTEAQITHIKEVYESLENGQDAWWQQAENGMNRQPAPAPAAAPVDPARVSEYAKLVNLRVEYDEKLKEKSRIAKELYKRGEAAYAGHNTLAELKDINALMTNHLKDLTASAPVPQFVLEAYVKSEITKRSECPILGIPLLDCEKLTMLSCYHIFDTKSIKTWLETKNSCPTCRVAKPSILVESGFIFERK